MGWRFLFVVVLLFVFQACEKQENSEKSGNSFGFILAKPHQPIGNIYLEANVPKQQRDILAATIGSLQTLPIQNPSSLLQQIIRERDAEPQTLLQWLENRVQYIVSENFDLVRNVIVQSSSYAYENPGILPVIEEPPSIQLELSSIDSMESAYEQTAKIIMQNLGGALYLAGKQASVLLGLKMQGVGTVAITSPRVGILQIGEGLFSAFPENQKMSATIFRLGTLFHEARHSDGNKSSLVFPHAICPQGSDYAGLNACDRNANGPYTVGAEVAKNLLDACVQCSIAEKQVIKLMILDWTARVLDAPTTSAWDDSPEGRR